VLNSLENVKNGEGRQVLCYMAQGKFPKIAVTQNGGKTDLKMRGTVHIGNAYLEIGFPYVFFFAMVFQFTRTLTMSSATGQSQPEISSPLTPHYTFTSALRSDFLPFEGWHWTKFSYFVEKSYRTEQTRSNNLENRWLSSWSSTVTELEGSV